MVSVSSMTTNFPICYNVTGSVESSPLLSSSAKQSSTAAKQSTPTKSRYHSPKVPQAVTSSDVKELCKELYNSVKDYTVRFHRWF